MEKTKADINIMVIGHKGSGKSTTIGFLVYNCGGIDESVKELLEQNTEGGEAGISTIVNHIWVLETIKSDVEVNRQQIKTAKWVVDISVPPANDKFIEKMMAEAPKTDCAILVVAAPEAEFEDNVIGNDQLRGHLKLANMLGIKQIICAVNKMDMTQPPYSETRFNKVKLQVSDLLQSVGYLSEDVIFVPISGVLGVNMVEATTNMPWYNRSNTGISEFMFEPSTLTSPFKPFSENKEVLASGLTLFEAIDSVVPVDRPTLMELPLRLPLEDWYKRGSETVPVGVVKTGVLRPGMKVTFAPSSTRAVEVISIEPSGNTMMDKSAEPSRLQMDEAIPGDHAGFSVKSVSVNDVSGGMVAGDAYNEPPEEAENFTALITVLNYPGEIRAGYTELVNVHTAHVSCTFSCLLQKFSSSGSIVEENVEKIKQGDIALVNLVPTKPLCVETFKDYPQLGQITVRGERNTTVAVGIIIYVKKKKHE